MTRRRRSSTSSSAAPSAILAGYGGNLLQLTLGDKGAYLYGVFGSPQAHEDDDARAAAAALELRDLEKTTAAREIQIGLSRGRLRSGTYGHAMRRTFVCLGDAVNLAARLMAKAPPGQVYVSEPVHDGAGDGFIWKQLPDLTVKGKAAPIVAYALEGSLERASRRRLRFELRLVGRRTELATLEARLADALAGRGQVLGLAAEAGMGKSRLVAEFVRGARRRGIQVAFGECQAYGSNTGYFAWREIWRRLFGLEDGDDAAAQIARIERTLAAIDPALVARAPLLGPVLDIEIEDSELTRGFEAKVRKSSLEDLLTICLRARAAGEPVTIVIEDCHWIDELSRDLLTAVARGTDDARVLFVLAYRPGGRPGRRPGPRAPAELPRAGARPAGRRRRRRGRALQAGAAGTGRTRRRPMSWWTWWWRAPTATRCTSRSWSATSSARASTCATAARCVRCSCRRACTRSS